MACKQQANKPLLTKLQQQQIDSVTRKTHFLPLVKDQAYQFLNQYYLPHLDTMYSKRKLLLYSLRGRNYQRLLQGEIKHIITGNAPIVLEAPGVDIDTSVKWDAHRLKNITLVQDTFIFHPHHQSPQQIKAWYKKYGKGYVCVSYPLYNTYTKKLIIEEYRSGQASCTSDGKYMFFYRWNGKNWEQY